MIRYWVLLPALALLLLAGNGAVAQGSALYDSDPAWQVSYWNNMSLSGTPVLQRSEPEINYDWHGGSPDSAVQTDHFSARWTRYLDLDPADYRITATADDGVRVLLDGDLIISAWNDHSALTYTVDRRLSGHHQLTMEYYENETDAVAKLSVTALPAPITNWRGEYFNNMNLSGDPVLVRDDASINFNWGSASPAPGIVNADQFSARWTRNLSLPAGKYYFGLLTDDGARLWVNNHLLVDAWKDQPPTSYGDEITLPGGSIPIKLEYCEDSGGSVVKLTYGLTDDQPSPGVVTVDNTSPGFVRGGAAAAWHSAAEGIGNQMYWTLNNDVARYNYNWARWYPTLSAGRYEVFAFIPDRYTTTAMARYWISHAGGFASRVVNQDANGGRWVSLGTYNFSGTRSDYVSLNDVTGESYVTRLIGFDAMKWERR